jgi:hypothetical protein
LVDSALDLLFSILPRLRNLDFLALNLRRAVIVTLGALA